MEIAKLLFLKNKRLIKLGFFLIACTLGFASIFFIRKYLLIETSMVSIITGIVLILRATYLDLCPPMMHVIE